MIATPQSAQIKSRDRVKNAGEVFTAEREVNAMLDLIPQAQFDNPLSTWLEPACGNGNFLIEILKRKVAVRAADVQAEIHALQVLSALYGVDIDQANVGEAIERLTSWLKANVSINPAFLDSAGSILRANIQVGNTLLPDQVLITQYQWTDKGKYSTRQVLLSDCKG